MDAVLFRSTQKFEHIQIQTEILATKTKDVLVLYTQQGKLFLLELWHSVKVENIRNQLKGSLDEVITSAKELQSRIVQYTNPKQIYIALLNIFGKKWTKREIYFGCSGLIIGGFIGLAIGLTIRKKQPIFRYMQAIQSKHNLGADSVAVVEDAIAPYECSEYDILVDVKASSVQIIDTQICNGYGRVLRRILQRMYKQSDSEFPVILGRDCTGIITDMGCKVKRLEVGDEVWLTVPFWSQGTLCQSVLVNENRVAKKPKNIGFESACSLPYAGSLALSALGEAHIDVNNAHMKKILVQGGCTPVGCILIQLLKNWKAIITTTCYKRTVPVVKALGASHVIVIAEPSTLNDEYFSEVNQVDLVLLKELEERGDIFDIIIKTSAGCDLNIEEFSKFLKPNGTIISTLPPLLLSDSCGVFSEFILALYINLKYKFQNILGLPKDDFDETHLCYVTLDKLAEFVEDGYLQTVVDKVFQPQDIEVALSHIQSSQSIGSTVISFR